MLYLDPIYVADTPREKGKKADRGDKGKKEGTETPAYSLEGHLAGKPQEIRSLVEDLRERIFSLDPEGAIIEKANKHYMVYKHGKNFCEVWIQNSQLKLWLDIPISDLENSFNIAKDVSNIGHWGTGEVEVNLENESQLDQVMALVEQAFRQTI